MAKVKKQNLTEEERLQQAVVLKEEQPYEIPGNWVWTKLGNVINLISGRDVPAIKCNNESRGIPYILGASNIENNSFNIERWIENPVVISIKGDILLSVKGTIGKIYLQQEPEVNISRQIMAVRALDCLNREYLKYYLVHISDLLKEAGNGLIPGISRETILNMTFPLPPLTEQSRIVERINTLIEKLDYAKELIQNALDTFENRKLTILRKAFNGELTKLWREDHNGEMVNWKNVSSNEIFEYVTSGSRGWAQYYSNHGAIFIRMGNLDHNTIELDLEDVQYVSLPLKTEGIRSKVQKNDILISITADVGMVALIKDNDLDAYINQHIALARPVSEVCAEYVAWYLVSDKGLKQFKMKQRGATKIGLGLSDIKSLNIMLPPLLEQKEIVRIINCLFEKEHRAKDLCDVIERIDVIKKIILARAFRGELGTNDHNEESAYELLKNIIKGTIVAKGQKQKVMNSKASVEVMHMYKNVFEALKLNGKMIPEDLKKLFDLDVDRFYEQVKLYVESGKITEIREGMKVYLEATDEG